MLKDNERMLNRKLKESRLESERFCSLFVQILPILKLVSREDSHAQAMISKLRKQVNPAKNKELIEEVIMRVVRSKSPLRLKNSS